MAFNIKDFLTGLAVKIKSTTDGSNGEVPHHIIDASALPTGAATQTTLAAVLAKLIAAPSTEAKQDAIVTALGLLGTQTTSAAILAKIIAAPATEAKQDAIVTALGGLGTQTTLAAILAKIIAAPSTEAKQDTGNTALNAIGALLTTQAGYLDGIEGLITATNAKDFATQTTLAAVLAKLIAAPATEAKQDTINAILGTTAGAAVITDANGTLQQYLRGLVTQWTAGTLTHAGQGVSAVVTLTRPNDTTAYGLNDVIGSSAAATAALQFSNMAPAAGGEVLLTSVSLEIDATGLISGEGSYRLYLYNVTPPSAIFDNVAFDVAAGDRASFLGYVDLGLPVDLGSTLYVQSDIVNKQIKLAGPNLFGYLVTNGIYTPTAQRVYVITLHGAPV